MAALMIVTIKNTVTNTRTNSAVDEVTRPVGGTIGLGIGQLDSASSCTLSIIVPAQPGSVDIGGHLKQP